MHSICWAFSSWRTCLARAGHGAYLAAQCHGYEAPKGPLRGKLEGVMTCLTMLATSRYTILLSKKICAFFDLSGFSTDRCRPLESSFFPSMFEEWTWRSHRNLKHVFSFTEDNDGSLSLEEFQKAFELLATSPTSSHKLRSVCLKSLVSRDESNLSSLWIG